MKTIYNSDLKAHLSIDEKGVVRGILHSQEYWLAENNTPQLAATSYLNSMADVLQIKPLQLKNIHQQVSYIEPRQQEIEYRKTEEKHLFDSSTFFYVQTIHNTPVWDGGVSISVKQNPARVVHSLNNSHLDLQVELPDASHIKHIKKLFGIASMPELRAAGEEKTTEEHPSAEALRQIIAAKAAHGGAAKPPRGSVIVPDSARINRGRFYIYRYDAAQRLPQGQEINLVKKAGKGESAGREPTLPLPPVSDAIEEGKHYLVAELLFTYALEPYGKLNWRALLDVGTGSVLYLRSFRSDQTGEVFPVDPKTSTGDLTMTPDKSNAVLNPIRVDRPLNNLDAPVMGTQSLRGTHVAVIDDITPAIAPPTQPVGNNFDYNARTNDFAAVSAYYHSNELFNTIESLGFPLNTYFDGTAFPVHVDHRAHWGDPGGIEINAYCDGDAGGDGIGQVAFMLSDTSNTADPLGRSVDKWVHWHEIGGHGVLWDHVNSPNFGFSHSAGDGLAAIQIDPESLLRALPERFQYAPFRPWPAGSERFFNRSVTSGWAWGGTHDDTGYQSEQILATCHFRIYQAMGGDSTDVNRRRFASRMASYLILRTIAEFNSGTNPGNAQLFCEKMMAVDLLNWTSEGYDGGAYNKLVRWSFEKQGAFQPVGAPTPVSAAGAPPEKDIYIEDGRHGEYPYQAVHWENQSVWNRQAVDGTYGHQPSLAGVANHAYVRVKNRGTQTATNIVVKLYHCLPGAGLTWPTDFVQVGPVAGLPIASLAPNSTAEVMVGPFDWVPNVNAYGHDCLLAISSCDGDPSNVDNFTAGESIEEWRLVPNDNNIGQRNVNPAPGGGETGGLMGGLQDRFFFAGNPFRRKAEMELRVELPELLRANGWQLRFKDIDGNRFSLKPGEKRKITLDPVPGKSFSADQVRATLDRTIRVSLAANGMVIGGMSYQLDPDMKTAPVSPGDIETNCKDKTNALLQCLKISGGKKVKKVCVKKVSLDIEFDNDCGCD